MSEKQSREDNTLFAALFFSVGLHAVILGFANGPFPNNGTFGKQTVSVTLKQASVSTTDISSEFVPALPPSETTDTVPHVENSPIAPPLHPHKQMVEQPSQLNQDSGAAEAAAADGTVSIFGMVNVILVVDADGKVGEIIWQTLPVLSQDELSRLEAELRTRRYSAIGKKYPLNKRIDVLSKR